MRPLFTAAAFCAASLFLTSSARAEDIPEPESRTVLVPPQEAPPAAEPPAPPAVLPTPPAREPAAARPDRPELGFQVRVGGAEEDRVHFGTSLVVDQGILTFGVSGDVTADVEGSGHHDEDRYDHDHDHEHYCKVRSNGRCTLRVDAGLSGFGGIRHKTGPVIGSSQLRLELVGEVGLQVSGVDERIAATATRDEYWSDAARAYPFAGLRAGVGLTVFRNAYLGIGAFARQGLAGKVCVNTDGGCTRVGGPTAGVFLFGGGEWGIGH